MRPAPVDVTDFLGKDPPALDDTHQISKHLDTVTAMVKAYTRGAGFDPGTGEPGDDLALVIVSSVARLVTNPSHTVSESVGPFAVRQAVFTGWTLPELAVLHRYRRRLA